MMDEPGRYEGGNVASKDKVHKQVKKQPKKNLKEKRAEKKAKKGNQPPPLTP